MKYFWKELHGKKMNKDFFVVGKYSQCVNVYSLLDPSGIKCCKERRWSGLGFNRLTPLWHSALFRFPDKPQ